ncbi:MAG: TlpA family protein disulfide reductase [Deltaproteobacteria bacterium]|nr:TlpA family protein disulfide reductase [Nannocystaceae bacterium]
MGRRDFATFVLLSLVACGPKQPGTVPPSAASPLLGKNVPEFKRSSMAGASVDTKAAVGKVMVVKFFAEYCQPCKVTLPEAQELAEKHDDVVFVGVAEDEFEATAQKLVAAYGLTFPIVHDRGQILAGRFRVSEMPVTFVIDATGVIRWVGGPGQGKGDLAQAIAAIRG